MKYCRIFLTIMAGIVATSAIAGLPFKRDWAGDHELPLPFGVGIDFYSMEQPYLLDSLTFDLPFTLPNPELIEVDNKITYFDVKFDAWLLPFLNVFAVVGDLDGETLVDFTPLGLPLPVDSLIAKYDGLVYGGGVVLAVGGDHWFAATTTTYTQTELDGDFESSVTAWTNQIRVGYHHRRFEIWAGGMHLRAEENHKGVFDFPVLGGVPFEVKLSEEKAWNTTLGLKVNFSKHLELVVERGFGDRETWLGAFVYRF